MSYLIDELWENLKILLTIMGCFIIAFIMACLFTIFCILPFVNNCYKGNMIYEYEDLNGNIGNATNCQFSDADYHYRKGGQGQPICFVGKKVIVVKWYEDKTEYGNCYKKMWEK